MPSISLGCLDSYLKALRAMVTMTHPPQTAMSGATKLTTSAHSDASLFLIPQPLGTSTARGWMCSSPSTSKSVDYCHSYPPVAGYVLCLRGGNSYCRGDGVAWLVTLGSGCRRIVITRGSICDYRGILLKPLCFPSGTTLGFALGSICGHLCAEFMITLGPL